MPNAEVLTFQEFAMGEPLPLSTIQGVHSDKGLPLMVETLKVEVSVYFEKPIWSPRATNIKAQRESLG